MSDILPFWVSDLRYQQTRAMRVELFNESRLGKPIEGISEMYFFKPLSMEFAIY